MKYLFMIICFIGVVGCSGSKNLNNFTSLIKNNTPTENGTIFLTVSAVGETKENAIENCVSNAFETVLFRGVPASVQPQPMIENEQKARSANPNFFDCFKNEACYKKFVTYINFMGEGVKVREGIGMSTSLKINLNALKTYLEQNNIIRKFGF